MDEANKKLKSRLEKALRRPIPDVLWNRFDGYGGQIEDYYEETLEPEGGERENFQALKGLFDETLDFVKACMREMTQSVTQPQADADDSMPVLEPSPNAYVRTRARAVSEYLAVYADERSDVSEYREKILGGRWLSPEDARALLGSQEPVVEDLRELGSRLAHEYLGWDEEGAVWYVLTGEAPRLHPIRTTGRIRSARGFVPFQHIVTLSVLPWVPAKEVERVYRNVQEQVLEERSRETSPRILEVAQFCWEQFRSKGPMPSWRTWCERWNQTYPGKRFETWRNFREYFERGRKKAIPSYKLPEPKPSPDKQEELRTREERLVKELHAYAEEHGNRFPGGDS